MNSTFFTSLSIDELSTIIKDSISSVIVAQKSKDINEPKTDDLLNIEDIQKIFNISKVTVHKWKKKGLIPFYKMNRKVYFKKSEVIESMAHKKRKLEA